MARASLWLPVLLLIAGVGLQGLQPSLLTTLRDIGFDQFQRWHPRPYVAAPVRIVDIDDESLARLGQWPWPRTRLADLVERLRAAGAAVIAFDVLFAEPDRTAPASLARQWNAPPDIAERLGRLPDPDALFARSIGGGGVVTAFALTRESTSGPGPSLPVRVVSVGEGYEPFLPGPYAGAVITLPSLQEAADGNGAMTFVDSGDGVIRQVPLLLRMDGRIVPSLALEALRVAQGARNVMVVAAGADGGGPANGVARLRVGGLDLETGRDGQIWLHYTEPRRDRSVPAWAVLDGSADPAALAGNLVFVGTSAKGLMDLRHGPFGIVPGVDIHAQLAEQAIQGTYLTRPDWAMGAEMLATVAAGLALTVLVARLRALWGLLCAALFVLATGFLAWRIFLQTGFLVDPLGPSLTLAAVFLAGSVPRAIRGEREQRWIRNAFSRYISPNLVRHLLADPGKLELGGEMRECSFVFTDLAGFTTMMERLDPAEAVRLLNGYLEGMVAIAFRHDGTLDRIVGDAVAVLFSAPVAQPDHARRALACARDMEAFSRGLEARYAAEGIPFGITRIGVHSGRVLVGNLGGSLMFDYRALGDPVNTASRLEGANRHLGTRVCVSADTVARVEDFIGRPIGRLVLKGKTDGIDAFEPLAAADPDYAAAFALLGEQSPEAPAAFAALSARRPDDGLVAFHLRRLRDGETGPRIMLADK